MGWQSGTGRLSHRPADLRLLLSLPLHSIAVTATASVSEHRQDFCGDTNRYRVTSLLVINRLRLILRSLAIFLLK